MSVEALIEAAKMGNIPEIQRLLAAGVNINGKDARGRTALQHAIMQNKEEAALELLRYPGVDVTVRSFIDGKTILMLAVESGMRRVLNVLIPRFPEIDCTVTDNNGESVIYYILDRHHMFHNQYSLRLLRMFVEHCGKNLFGVEVENIRGRAAMNPIKYANALAKEVVAEFDKLHSEINEKRSRGEEPTPAEMGLYNWKRRVVDNLLEIISYMEAQAPRPAAAAGNAAARRRRSTRRDNRRRRRNRRDTRNRK